MQLITTIFLVGLLAVVIPIIIHLIKSNKAQKLWLGSLKFLEQAMQVQRRRKSWIEVLLLILRALAIVALVLLFARPFDYKSSVFNPEQQATVLMIDVSGSMSGKLNSKNMLQQAKEKAEVIKKSPNYKGEIILAVFADDVKEISSLDSIGSVTSCGTNYKLALEWGQNRLIKTGKKYLRLVIVTDCQKSGLADIQNLDWPPAIDFQLEQILPVDEANRGIQSAIGGPFVKDRTSYIEIKQNTHDSLNNSKYLLLVNNKKQNIKSEFNSISWKPGFEDWFNAKLSCKNNDAYPFDNSYFIRDFIQIRQTVQLINGKSGNSRFNKSTYFINKTLTVEENEGRSLLVKEFDRIPSDFGDVIIFCDGGKMNTVERNHVKKYVENGGSVLFFLGSNSKQNDINELYEAELFPAKMQYVNQVVSQPVTNWNLKHPVLSLFKEKSGVGLNSIIFEKHFLFDNYTNEQLIAGFEDGTPAILEKKLGKGKVIMVSNPVNRDWGDWSIGRLFVPLIRELINYMVNEEKTAIKPETSVCGLLSYPFPGIYNNNSLVVNADPSEQNISILNVDEFKEAIGVINQDQNTPGINQITREKHPGEERQSEWSHYLALLLFGLLFIELIFSYLIKK